MAYQSFDALNNCFFLDLHGVLKRDAARIISKRLEECSRYGVAALEIVYGTPDIFDGSIASMLHRVVTQSKLVRTDKLPPQFVSNCADYAFRIPKISIPLESMGPPAPRDEALAFAPFAASREPDIWLRRRCENTFRPFQTLFSKEEAARITGRGCRVEDISEAAFNLEELERFCREWVRPAHEQPAPEEPDPSPAQNEESLEERIERAWTQLWSDADELRKRKQFRASGAKLQRCLDLAAQSTNRMLLARTLSALAILAASTENPEQSEAYRASANAAYASQTGAAQWERLALTTSLADDAAAEGRIEEAAHMLAEERELLGTEEHVSALVVYVLQKEAALRLRLAQHSEAGRLYAQALEAAENDPNTPYSSTAHLRLQLGLLAAGRGDLRPALAHLTQAAEEFELAPDASPVQRFLCLREVAAIADQVGYGARSQEILLDLIAMPVASGSVLEIVQIEARIDLGNLYFRQRLWAEAERRYLQVLSSLDGSLPADTVFTVHENLSVVYLNTGRFEEAQEQLAKADHACREIPRFGSLRYAHLRTIAAELHDRAGRSSDAKAVYDEVLKIYSQEDAQTPDVAQAYFQMGLLMARGHDLDEAEYHLRIALGINERIFGEGSPMTADNLVKLGHVLSERGSLNQARTMLAHGIRVIEEYRSSVELLAEAYASIANTQRKLGQMREARKSEEKAQFYAYSARSAAKPVSELVN